MNSVIVQLNTRCVYFPVKYYNTNIKIFHFYQNYISIKISVVSKLMVCKE